MLKVERTNYGSKREKRSQYVADRFQPFFSGKSVLDVGCYQAPLRTLLSDSRYTGVDFTGDPDITVDLQQSQTLPFEDNAFDTVICIEVLEHLDELHKVFAELVRVSKQHLIISLPNCWRDARLKIERGTGHFAHYGLPGDAPTDRHRWFFNVTQAHDFIKAQQAVHPIAVEACFVTEQNNKPIISSLRRLRYPKERYLNRYAQTIWAVYATNSA